MTLVVRHCSGAHLKLRAPAALRAISGPRKRGWAHCGYEG